MAAPVLEPGETEIVKRMANRTVSARRTLGGHLLLTDRRLMFYVHAVDAATGGTGWECPLTAITNVGLAPRGRNPFDGSMRRRLQVDFAGGTEFFIVNGANALIGKIQVQQALAH